MGNDTKPTRERLYALLAEELAEYLNPEDVARTLSRLADTLHATAKRVRNTTRYASPTEKGGAS